MNACRSASGLLLSRSFRPAGGISVAHWCASWCARRATVVGRARVVAARLRPARSVHGARLCTALLRLRLVVSSHPALAPAAQVVVLCVLLERFVVTHTSAHCFVQQRSVLHLRYVPTYALYPHSRLPPQ